MIIPPPGGTEPIDEKGNTGSPNRYCSGQVLDSYRLESDLPVGGQSRIDVSNWSLWEI